MTTVNHGGALPSLQIGARGREILDVERLHVFAEFIGKVGGDIFHAVVVQQDSRKNDRELSAAAVTPERRPSITCLHTAVQVDAVLHEIVGQIDFLVGGEIQHQ